MTTAIRLMAISTLVLGMSGCGGEQPVGTPPPGTGTATDAAPPETPEPPAGGGYGQVEPAKKMPAGELPLGEIGDTAASESPPAKTLPDSAEKPAEPEPETVAP